MDSSLHPLDLEDVWYTWVTPKGGRLPPAGRRIQPNFSSAQWRFFGAVAEIRSRMEEEVEMDVEDPMAPTVHFALRNDEYWLRLECPNEANQPPVLRGAFISGFEYEWNAGKRLVDLVEEYHAYAVNMDNAIGHIKEIDAHEVKLIGYDLAENGEGDEGSQESEEIEEEEGGGVSLRVRIKVAGGVGEVRLHVAVNDPLAYPRAIKMVEKGELLRELKADTWQAGESLVGNLVELFSEIVAAGEVAEAYEKSGMEGGGEEDEEEWNAEWWSCGAVIRHLLCGGSMIDSRMRGVASIGRSLIYLWQLHFLQRRKSSR